MTRFSDPIPQLPQICRLYNSLARTEDFSGVVRLQQGDTVLLNAAYGYANRAWRKRNHVQTRFRIASIGKMFTAVAVLRLIEQGLLRWDTRPVELLSLQGTSLPSEATIYHYLTMTAGIGDYFDEEGDPTVEWDRMCRLVPLHLLRDQRSYLPLFIDRPALGPVGQTHVYSNASYILLGLVIEHVTQESYFEAVRRLVFEPAGMEQTNFTCLDDLEPDTAEGYIPLDVDGQRTGWRRNVYYATPGPAADGGATSTARDLVRFIQALRKGKLLSQDSTALMLTPQVLDSHDAAHGCTWMYGLGNFFMLDAVTGDILRWGHTGEEEGISCRLYHYPAIDLDVVILGNQNACAGAAGWALHDILTRSEEALT